MGLGGGGARIDYYVVMLRRVLMWAESVENSRCRAGSDGENCSSWRFSSFYVARVFEVARLALLDELPPTQREPSADSKPSSTNQELPMAA